MKKIKKIGALITIFILNFYNTCFADLVLNDTNGEMSGGKGEIKPPVSETNPVVDYILIGILVLVVVVCAVLIIRRIIKNKKEKENDNT